MATEIAANVSAQPANSINWNFTAPSTINVFFASGGVSVNDGAFWATSAWSGFEQAQAMQAFAEIEEVANVTFNFVNSIANADFVMFESTNATTDLGYWAVGGGSLNYGGQTYFPDGWGVFNSNDSSWNTQGLAKGGFGYVTIIHEIGHGLGLAHPHDGGGRLHDHDRGQQRHG